jgi:hypothetical protein
MDDFRRQAAEEPIQLEQSHNISGRGKAAGHMDSMHSDMLSFRYLI